MPALMYVGALAVIHRDGCVLAARRAPDHPNGGGGLWELPSGRLEAGEGLEEGLVREVREETELEIEVVAPVGTWVLPDRPLVGVAFACEYLSGEVRLSAEHSDYRWVPLEVAEAFLAETPVVGHVRRYLAWRRRGERPDAWLRTRGGAGTGGGGV